MTESTNDSGTTGTGAGGSAADYVRQAFSALPWDQKFSTLIKIELDMLGDAVDTVASTVSKAVDEIVRCCECPAPSASATPGAGAST